MAEKYHGMSPYAYCAGNPEYYSDPNGKLFGRAVIGAGVEVGMAYFAGKSGKELWGAAAQGAIEGSYTSNCRKVRDPHEL